MQAVILAGGLGTRLSEETTTRPKPMVEIGDKPILWHILKIYSAFGINEFIICLGYKGYQIKEYFANYFLHTSNVTFDIGANRMQVLDGSPEPWRVTLVDTGQDTMTGGRLQRVLPYIGEDPFCFTYGDGVADIDIAALIAHHRRAGRIATVTAVQPPGRFGLIKLRGERVESMVEKPEGDGGWINAGFFVLSKQVGAYLTGDDCTWEREPLKRLAGAGQLSAYCHRGFWQPMDTLRDKRVLEDLWQQGQAPWKVW